VYDWDYIAEFGLKCRVEVCAALNSGQAIAVGEFGEYPDITAVFELDTWGSSKYVRNKG